MPEGSADEPDPWAFRRDKGRPTAGVANNPEGSDTEPGGTCPLCESEYDGYLATHLDGECDAR